MSHAMFRYRGAREDVAEVLAALPADAPQATKDAYYRLRACLSEREEPFVVSLIRAMGGRATIDEVLRVGQYRNRNSAHSLLSQAAGNGFLWNVALHTYALAVRTEDS
jgi:hypothetical protein